MPTDAERELLLLDTSAAVALCVADHDHHAAVVSAVSTRSLGLAGHAAFETFSVLTRLPPPLRRPPAAVGSLLAQSFPATRYLSEEGARAVLEQMAKLGLGGGAVYDALVGATAVEHGLGLLTRDRRALPVYRALAVDVEVVADEP
jgi:predicted nucleic acid-binding protein